MSDTRVKKHRYEKVEIEWEDSCATNGWHQYPTTTPTKCWTTGYLVYSDKRVMTIALNASSNESVNNFGDTITVPKVNVLKVRKLK